MGLPPGEPDCGWPLPNTSCLLAGVLRKAAVLELAGQADCEPLMVATLGREYVKKCDGLWPVGVVAALAEAKAHEVTLLRCGVGGPRMSGGGVKVF